MSNNCFCIKGNYDFYIDVIDTKTIVYHDLSSWMEEEPYVLPSTYTVSLKLPTEAVFEIEVKPKTSTIIKAEDLPVLKFKDGIYCFTIDALSPNSGGCGDEYVKTTGIFPNLDCCLNSAYSKLEDEYYERIKEVEHWLSKAKISSQLEMEKQAYSEYDIAKRKLAKLNCNCNC